MAENQKFTVYEFIGNLYTLKNTVFTLADYSDVCNLISAQAQKQIDKMLEMKLICKLRLEGKTTYKVVSNLLIHAINRNMDIKGINSI
mgnify:FL=1